MARLSANIRRAAARRAMELQAGLKPSYVVRDLLRAEFSLSDAHLDSVLQEAAGLWAAEGDNAKRQRHVDTMTRLAGVAEQAGHLAVAAKLLIEIGKVQGLGEALQVAEATMSEAEEARLKELEAKARE